MVEGVVIVGSILLAFLIDAGWDARADRITERGYLQRLLEDVRYDRAENRLVADVLTAALAESEVLLNVVDADTLLSVESERLVPLFLRATDRLRPDYSRAAYQELVGAGRIGLIRSLPVRAALANYDRNITNYSVTWEASPESDSPLYRVRIRSVPADAATGWLRTCRQVPRDVCPIDFDDGVAATIRGRLNHSEVAGDIRESMSTQSRILRVVQEVMEPAAVELEATLLAALRRQD